MRLLASCLLIGGLLSVGAPPAPDAAEIDRLIEQLGSAKYAEREAAGRRLETIGLPALDALRKKAATTDDLEIRCRARDLIQAIEDRAFPEKLPIEAIRRLGGKVETDSDRPDQSAITVSLWAVPNADACLEHVKKLPKLQVLELTESNVTTKGLKHLRGLTSLRTLDLSATTAGNAGLEHLQGLTGLRELDLFNTDISDAGLVHLRGLTNLRSLSLGYNDEITDKGLANLKGLTKLKKLDLDYLEITDAGLEHLKGLTALQELNLLSTKVTPDGVARLKALLPNLRRVKYRPPSSK